jgi:Zn-dependent protease with chaperone function
VAVAAVGAAGPALVVGIVLAVLVGPIEGGVGFVVVTMLGTALLLRRSTAVALRLLGAVPCDDHVHTRLYNVTEGLCATFGLRMPELWTIEDPVPNACALGHRRGDAVLVFTSGVLDRLGLIELEGLVAHELAHVKRHETTIAGVAIVVLWPIARLTGRDAWLHTLLGEGREYRADQLAAATIRYPVGLHDALVDMAGGPEPSATSVFAAPRLAMSRWIWADPDPGARPATRADLGASLDAIGVRTEALAQW